jgi:hypothetical protein
MQEIMKLAHQFLQNFCAGNQQNQALLHKHINLFLNPGVRQTTLTHHDLTTVLTLTMTLTLSYSNHLFYSFSLFLCLFCVSLPLSLALPPPLLSLPLFSLFPPLDPRGSHHAAYLHE